ncbi:uncharacterized protein BO88DRAFT_128849 [Aspergillus vadensis CBS 113365]|uniref:Uncharacterized protein n=1 Tax=Aspergillus vadensis (strain CBS 113365 / IMI 142717 / IBT 24658) TaxID=1448311 RepID=A0A319B232_ASPVC|nr:hypothetical protein BO88DRAFT_128849 [Aspergillus vadensis CBS 113365]PYH65904.1 hypothetical protein BO88DRAFT_128849 [Aspergillus vadensis CBS 113365]
MIDSHVNDIVVMSAFPCLCHPCLCLMSDHVHPPSPISYSYPLHCPFLCCLFVCFLFFRLTAGSLSDGLSRRTPEPHEENLLGNHGGIANHAGLYHSACHLQMKFTSRCHITPFLGEILIPLRSKQTKISRPKISIQPGRPPRTPIPLAGSVAQGQSCCLG